MAVAGANLTYPAIGVLPNGEGAMAFTTGRPDELSERGMGPDRRRA